MTPAIPSRDATLEDVLHSVLNGDISSRLRDDVSSAVRTVARLLGCAPTEIPADPRLLGMRLSKVSPQSAGISPARMSNIKSLLRRALNLHGLDLLPGRTITPMSSSWRALYSALPSRAHRVRLSKLLRWLSVRRIEPNKVELADLEKFTDELRRSALMTKSDDAWRDTAWAWNSVRNFLDGWPPIEIKVPKRQQTYSLPWTAFPSALVADVNAYLDRLSGKDPLGPSGFRAVKLSTRVTRERQLRALASAIVHRGIAIESLTALADLIHLPHFKEGLRYFLERRNNERSTTIAQLAGAMKAIAKHWVKVSPEHLAAMTALVGNVTPREPNGMTQKNRNRLRVFDDPENVSAILHLPQKLAQEAASGRFTERRSAVLMQTAVAIELLLMRPIRLDNLRTLDLDKNFLRPRKGGWIHIMISADEVKNEVELEHRLPHESAKLLDLYIRQYRSAICDSENRKLFPGISGGCKAINTLRSQMVRAIYRHTGLQMNPHLFRHLAAKPYLDANPGEYEIVREVLAHKSLSTTTRVYTGFERDAAVRRYDSTISQLRASTLPPGRRPPSSANRSF